jgi:hypothetical protein
LTLVSYQNKIKSKNVRKSQRCILIPDHSKIFYLQKKTTTPNKPAVAIQKAKQRALVTEHSQLKTSAKIFFKIILTLAKNNN